MKSTLRREKAAALRTTSSTWRVKLVTVPYSLGNAVPTSCDELSAVFTLESAILPPISNCQSRAFAAASFVVRQECFLLFAQLRTQQLNVDICERLHD